MRFENYFKTKTVRGTDGPKGNNEQPTEERTLGWNEQELPKLLMIRTKGRFRGAVTAMQFVFNYNEHADSEAYYCKIDVGANDNHN